MTDTATATNPITDPALRALAVETDTALAELDAAYAKLDGGHDRAVSVVRRVLRHRSRQITRTEVEWPTTPAEAIAELSDRLAAGSLKSWDAEDGRKALAAITEAIEEMAANRLRAAQLDEVWADNGYWSRYFLVDANNGHLHYDISGYRCSRKPTTAHLWNPALSGMTEAEAVAQLGPLLCTVCFPSAPVEWTVGHAKPERCAGSGLAPASGTDRRHGRKVYGDCPTCGEGQLLTSAWRVRAHKPKA